MKRRGYAIEMADLMLRARSLEPVDTSEQGIAVDAQHGPDGGE